MTVCRAYSSIMWTRIHRRLGARPSRQVRPPVAPGRRRPAPRRSERANGPRLAATARTTAPRVSSVAECQSQSRPASQSTVSHSGSGSRPCRPRESQDSSMWARCFRSPPSVIDEAAAVAARPAAVSPDFQASGALVFQEPQEGWRSRRRRRAVPGGPARPRLSCRRISRRSRRWLEGPNRSKMSVRGLAIFWSPPNDRGYLPQWARRCSGLQSRGRAHNRADADQVVVRGPCSIGQPSLPSDPMGGPIGLRAGRPVRGGVRNGPTGSSWSPP